MKYWLHVLIVVLLGFLLNQWMPWWIIAIISALSAYLLRTHFWLSGMYGFLAGILLWGAMATYLDIENQHILGQDMGAVFGGVSGLTLIAITGLCGGLLASLGSLFGSSFRTKKTLSQK